MKAKVACRDGVLSVGNERIELKPFKKIIGVAIGKAAFQMAEAAAEIIKPHIMTGVVVSLPFLFAGSLLLESFFAIPGMGSFMLDAIQRQDFAVVQAMVSLGSFLYIMGLLLTDISYTLVDPRVRLE